MNFAKLIIELKEAGMGEREIARQVDISQSSIRHMQYHGGQPRWNTGEALIKLHTETIAAMAKRWGT